MIEVQNLCKSYGERKAIDNLNFQIATGDVVGLLGPNGAGKSTTMKIITGFMAPTSGVAKICGFDVFEKPLEVKKRIGYLPEAPPVYLDMTIEDYLLFVAELKQVDSKYKNDFILKSLQKTQLVNDKKRLIRNLSKGFKQRVGIAQALVSNPEVLVLDEPTVGLDPKQVAEVRALIRELKGEHTIILSTHILPEVQATCNKVIIIHQGRIVAQDDIDKIEKLNQNLNSGRLTVSLRVRESKPIKEILQKIDGVLSVEERTDLNYTLHIQGTDKIIDLVATEVIRSGAGLLEIAPDKENLENVFLKLTYERETGGLQ